ncbi:MAG: Lhr family helicase, partial [Anaerolineae bacterium]
AMARSFEDFPIIAETYRDCLRDVLDLAHLEEVLHAVGHGEIEVITVETVVPSPVAASLLHDLIAQYMYEWDQPKAERQMQALMVGRELLSQLLDEALLPDLLRPEAVHAVDDLLQHLADGTRARTPDELTTVFLALGDLSMEEAIARCDAPQGIDAASWVEGLIDQGRLVPLPFPSGRRYVLAEQAAIYGASFARSAPAILKDAAGAAEVQAAALDPDPAQRAILRRVLSTHGPLSRDWLLDRYPWEPAWLDAALQDLIDEGSLVHGRITSLPTRLPVSQPASPPTQYCDRRNLERIHRQTLALLRAEVEPVPAFAYADFLVRWQHLHPAERLSGPGALVRLLQQVRGLPVHGAIWERDLLPLRLESFDPAELESLCERGEVVWVGSGGVDPRHARVRFLFRGEGAFLLPPEAVDPDLSPGSAQVLAFLQAEGASFFADLEAGTDLTATQINEALVELVLAGLVTNDTLAALRCVLSWSAVADAPSRPALSSLEAELAAWRASHPPSQTLVGSPPDRSRLHRARRDVARRMARRFPVDERAGDPGSRWPGRWSLVHRIGVWGREVPFEDRVARQARQLLQCYGIVTRENLAAWDLANGDSGWDWGSLYRQFQWMEMRGEVRRGYFVQALPGVQFALPEAVERLRAWSQTDVPGAEELILVNAADPANIYGLAKDLGTSLPDQKDAEYDPARFMRIPANYTVLLRGRPVLLLETGGQRLISLLGLPPQTFKQAVRLAMEHTARRGGRLILETWNRQPILDSPVAPLLEEVGFRREALIYVWD